MSELTVGYKTKTRCIYCLPNIEVIEANSYLSSCDYRILIFIYQITARQISEIKLKSDLEIDLQYHELGLKIICSI